MTHLTLSRRFFAAMAVIAPIAVAPIAQAQTALRIGSAQLSIASLPVVVAMQQKLFEAEGIKAEIIDFEGGGPAVQALAGGGIDVCVCAGDHAIRLASRGLGGAVITALLDKHPYALMARADAPASDLKSLKGKRIGITSPGSLTDNSIRYVIREAGLNPDTDVELIGAGTGGSMLAAVDSGAVAAGMFSTPDVQANLATGKYKIVYDFRELDYMALDLVAVGSWLKANNATAKATVRAMTKALTLIQQDPAVIEAAVKERFPKLPAELVGPVARDAAQKGLSRDGRAKEDGFTLAINMLRTADPSVKPLSYKDVVALQYLP